MPMPDPASWPQLPPPGCSGGEAVAQLPAVVAERMAQLIWGGSADEPLLARVRGLSPYTAGNLGCLAREMLVDRRARGGIRKFYMAWLDLNRKPNESYVDPKLVPEFSPLLLDSARIATERFIEHVFFEGTGTLRELLLAPYAFSAPALDLVYGRQSTPGELTQHYFRGEDRQGIFTQAYFLMTRSTASHGSPTQRGLSVVTSAHCFSSPVPPAGVRANATIGDQGTTRTAYDELYANPVCMSCHVFAGKPGYAFEHFDVLGRFRSTENGFPVDTRTEVPALPVSLPDSAGNAGGFRAVNGAVDWMNYISSSLAGRQCHAAHWLAYARTFDTDSQHYRELWLTPDREAIEYVTARTHLADQMDLRELVVAITETKWFVQ